MRFLSFFNFNEKMHDMYHFKNKPNLSVFNPVNISLRRQG